MVKPFLLVSLLLIVCAYSRILVCDWGTPVGACFLFVGYLWPIEMATDGCASLADPAKPGAALQTPLLLWKQHDISYVLHNALTGISCDKDIIIVHAWNLSWLPPSLHCRHAQTVRDSSSSYKIDYVIVIKNYINPEGHQNPISGSKFTAILLKGGFCLSVEPQRGRVCACSLRSRLVSTAGLW